MKKLLLCLVLTGCAAVPTIWHGNGHTEQEFKRDAVECDYMAQTAFGRQPAMLPPAYAYPPDPFGVGFFGYASDSFAALASQQQNYANKHAFAVRCMEARGYSRDK